MTDIKYLLCPAEQTFAAGETDLKEGLQKPLNLNGCTILLCTEGKAIVSVNLQKQVLKKGDVAFLLYYMKFVPLQTSETFSVRYISLPMEVIKDALYKIASASFWDFIYATPIFYTTQKQYAQVDLWYLQTKWIIEECISEYHLPLLSNNIYNFLMIMDSEIRQNTLDSSMKRRKDRSKALFGRFAILVSEYCYSNRDVLFYANKLCISSDYLYKLTFKTMNLSPKEFIDLRVIVEIKFYLSNTNLSVKNIATKFHFDDPSYMCRFFRRLAGVSPIDYRNSHK